MTTALGFVQNPRLQLQVNGQTIESPLSAHWVNNNYTEAGTFSVQFCVTQAEAQLVMSQEAISVEIQVSTNGSAWQSVMYGFVDAVELDPLSLHCNLTGRDLIALFVDTASADVSQNVPASQVLTEICAGHVNQGLKAQIANSTATVEDASSEGPALGATAKPNTKTTLANTKLVGRHYGGDYRHVKERGSQWELMLALAQGLGYDLRMGGPDQSGNLLDAKTLYFGPPPASESTAFTITVDYGPPVNANVENISVTRRLTLAGKVTVVAQGWSSSTAQNIIQTVSTTPQGTGAGIPNQKNQVYYFKLPGDLTPQQALAFAQSKLAQVSAFERDVHFTLPGELTLTPSNIVTLAGTNTAADQTYFIDEIARSISFESGFTETIRCKNHSPYNVGVTVPPNQQVEP